MFGQGLSDLRLQCTRRMSVTVLESRCVPATTAIFASGSLAIIGDDGNQAIVVSQLGPEAYRVDGLTGGPHAFSGVKYLAVHTKKGADQVHLWGGGPAIERGVTVSGEEQLTVVNDRFNINPLSGGFSVSDTSAFDVSVFIQPGTFLGRGFGVTTGGGNDSVVMGVAEVYGSVQFRLGSGSNTTILTSVDIEGALTVAGGTGIDKVELTNTRLGNFKPGYLDLNLGGGSDNVKVSGLGVNGNGQIVTSTGKLNLALGNSWFNGYLDIGAREVLSQVSDSKFASRLRIATGSTTQPRGSDGIFVRGVTLGGDLTIQTGANWQYVAVQNTTVLGNMQVSGSGGAIFIMNNTGVRGGMVIDYLDASADHSAEIRITRSTVNYALYIATGVGADRINVTSSAIAPAWNAGVSMINTGGGNDRVDLSGTYFYGNTRFDGGDDDDTLLFGGARFLGLPPLVVNFENVN